MLPALLTAGILAASAAVVHPSVSLSLYGTVDVVSTIVTFNTIMEINSHWTDSMHTSGPVHAGKHWW
jgi:hypothetical protein